MKQLLLAPLAILEALTFIILTLLAALVSAWFEILYATREVKRRWK